MVVYDVTTINMMFKEDQTIIFKEEKSHRICRDDILKKITTDTETMIF